MSSGSSGEEVKISNRPIREAEIENPEPSEPAHSVEISASGSESEDSDQEQDFVSSVVTGGGTGPKGRTGILIHRGERNAASAHMEKRDGEKDKDAALECTAEVAVNEDGSKRPARDEYKDENLLQQPNTEVDKDRNHTRAVTDQPEMTVEATADQLSACSIEEKDTRVDNGVEQPGADCTPSPGLNVTQVGMSRRGAAELRNLLNVCVKDPAAAVRAGLLERLNKTLREWRTEETMRFLHGTAYRPVEEEEEEEEELDEDDLEESEEAQASRELSRGGRGKPSAPAPDYSTLQRETELLNLRVQEFYRGPSVRPEGNTGPEVSSGDAGL